jgi:hypothetical protein
LEKDTGMGVPKVALPIFMLGGWWSISVPGFRAKRG